uniref:Prominin 1 b n=1 Tax=Monopterus albus TaxID=43700 RepID=A0A3Q3IL44_MONAL
MARNRKEEDGSTGKVISLMVADIVWCVRADPRKQRTAPPVEPLDFGFVWVYAYYEPGAIGVLFHMVHAFLYAVQPNPFPKGEIIIVIVIIEVNNNRLHQCNVLIIVHGIGICLDSPPLISQSLGSFLAVGTLVRCTSASADSPSKDLKTLANNTSVQIEYLTAQYTTVKNKVLSDLNSKMNTHTLFILPVLVVAMRETKEALENISSSLEVLQEGTGKLLASLSAERASLSNTLSDPACTNGAIPHTCNTIQSTLSQIRVSADFSKLPDVSHALANVNIVLRTDLSNIVQKGYSSFNDTPKLVKEQTKNIISGKCTLKDMLDKIGTEISSFSKMFPVETSMANFIIYLNQQQKTIESFYPQIDQIDFYRWIGCVVVLCMVVLVLAFSILGVTCGSCGYDKQATPTTRGCLSNTGGNLLMAGVGFSFIFAWVLMAIVTTLFVLGGNVEKLMCEPLANRQLFEILDTPFLIHPTKKNFLPGMLFQNWSTDLTWESMYRECYENNGLYHALQLETMFKINYFLNRSLYNQDLAKVFEKVQVDLQDVTLLEQAGRDNLINFANSGIGHIDYEAYLFEVNKGVTQADLLSFSTDLEAQADQLPRGALQNALKGHASSIRQIQREQVVPMEQAMVLSSPTAQTVKVTNILSAIDAAEYLIAYNASNVVTSGTETLFLIHTLTLICFLCFYVYKVCVFSPQLTAEVAQCKPISNIVDSVEIVACSFIVDSVNTFWFGLGGCCILLIPSILFSVKLAKYYRRMDTEDVFEDGQDNWN